MHIEQKHVTNIFAKNINIYNNNNMDFGAYRIIKQSLLRRVYAYAQTRQRLRCAHTQSIDIGEDTGQKLDLYPYRIKIASNS